MNNYRKKSGFLFLMIADDVDVLPKYCQKGKLEHLRDP